MPTQLQEPWLSFLRDVDQALTQPLEVHCLGGFVLSVLWGLPRPTGDIDFIEARPSSWELSGGDGDPSLSRTTVSSGAGAF